MTRIIAGRCGGRRIAVPPNGARPTSERVREALFSSLEAGAGLAGAGVLDLCAGSGALGLEALSRGAAHALFVEADRRAAATLRRNAAALGLSGAARVRAAPVAVALGARASRRYDLLLADPPYATPNDEIVGWLRLALRQGWLAEDARVVLERPTPSGPVQWPEPLRPDCDRRYGDTTLHTACCYGYAP